LTNHFREQILPVLTFAGDRTRRTRSRSSPPNGGFSLVFSLQCGRKREQLTELLMIPVPTLPRFVALPPGGGRAVFIAIEARDRSFRAIFPGFVKSLTAPSGILRDSDIEVDDESRIWCDTSARRSSGGGVARDSIEHDDTPRPDVEALVRQGTRADWRYRERWLIGDRRSGPNWSRPICWRSNSRPHSPRFPERILSMTVTCSRPRHDFIIHHPMKASRWWSLSRPGGERSGRSGQADPVSCRRNRRSSTLWSPRPKAGKSASRVEPKQGALRTRSTCCGRRSTGRVQWIYGFVEEDPCHIDGASPRRRDDPHALAWDRQLPI
jgi:hypothetical protein